MGSTSGGWRTLFSPRAAGSLTHVWALSGPNWPGTAHVHGSPFFFLKKTSIRAVVQECVYIHSPSVCELDILSQLLACFFIPCSVALLGGWVGHRSLCFHKIG